MNSWISKRAFKLSELNPFLVCSICDGYFRFAHTIDECGHTFCSECLELKKPKLCPQCDTPIDKSQMKKDPFKQNIVDLIYPQFQAEDQKVIHRMKDIFGDAVDERSIQNHIKAKDYLYQPRRKKVKRDNSKDNATFSQLVTETLGITMDEFKRDIYQESKFGSLLDKAQMMKDKAYPTPVKVQFMQMKEQRRQQYQQRLPIPKKQPLPDKKEPEPNIQLAANELMISIVPLNTEDEKIVKSNWDIKVKKRHSNVTPQLLRLKTFIFDSIDQDTCIKKNLVNKDKMNADNIRIYYGNKPIQSTDILTFPNHNNEPITIHYEILFKR